MTIQDRLAAQAIAAQQRTQALRQRQVGQTTIASLYERLGR